MPTLARAASAIILYRGFSLARISGLARPDSSARMAKDWGQDSSGSESFAECSCGGRLDCAPDSVPMRLLCILPLLLAMPAPAQVEKIAMRTTGISCGICAGLSEVYFRRLPGVDQVKISLRTESIMLTYKPGADFDPEAIRKILEPLKVGVVQFQIGARGQVEESSGKRFLLAGRYKFELLDAIDSPAIPLNAHVRVEGILFDHAKPMELKVLTSKAIP
jgi:hypothetical protein